MSDYVIVTFFSTFFPSGVSRDQRFSQTDALKYSSSSGEWRVNKVKWFLGTAGTGSISGCDIALYCENSEYTGTAVLRRTGITGSV